MSRSITIIENKIFVHLIKNLDKNSNQKLRHAVAVLPWGHNLLLINKKLSDEAVLYYAQEAFSQGWKRELLQEQINKSLSNK